MEIKLENCVVRKWDKVYCELLKKILEEGELFENRTGIDTLSIEGVYFKLDVGKEFPILESKKVVLKNAVSEIQWIHQVQSNDVNWLEQRGNNIWNEWKIDEDGVYRIYEPSGEYDPEKTVTLYDLDGKVMYEDSKPVQIKSLIEGKTIKSAKFFGKEFAGTIGTAYGWINNKFKRPQQIEYSLKNNPHDRRMILSLWQDEYIKTAVLPSCVWSCEFKVCNGKLNAFVHQRSADVPLGLPFNVSQYAILLSMFAKASGYEVGNLNWSIMDAHIYVNQIDGIKKQLSRYDRMLEIERKAKEDIILLEKVYLEQQRNLEFLKSKTQTQADLDMIKELEEELMISKLMFTKEKAELVLADKSSFFDFGTEYNVDKEYLKENPTGNEDIKVLKYSHAPFIKMPVAQ